MATRKSKPEVIKVISRPHGLEAVYERNADGTVTRVVVEAGTSLPAEPASPEETA